MRSMRSLLAASSFIALFGGAIPAVAADAILSGLVKSSDGAAIGGVMVSAKPQGGTITTTVLTDESGRYFFPPLAAGKYRVWAQALAFATDRGEVDLL
jgi:virginiamycin B lyase